MMNKSKLAETREQKSRVVIYIIMILLFAVVSRVVVFDHVYQQNSQNIVFNDTPRYENPALNLLHKGSLAINPDAIDTPSLSTTPGYSLFIASVYKIFSEKRYPLIIIQILVSALNILIVYSIAAKLWNSSVALIAMVLMAVSPLQILYSQVILSETLFTLFFVLSLLSAMYLITVKGKSRRYYYKWAFLFGLMIACCTMIRPISYYLVVFIVMGFILFHKSLGWESKQLIKIVSLIMLPAIILYGSWQIRNGLLTGVYEINDAKSETMLFWKAKGVLMAQNGIDEIEAERQIKEMLPPTFHSFKEKFEIEKKLGVKIITENLADYIDLSVDNLKDLLLGVGVDTQARYYGAKIKKENINIAGNMVSIVQQNQIISTLEKVTGYKIWYAIILIYSVILLLSTYFFSACGFFCSFNRSPQVKVFNLLMLGIVLYFIFISTGHASAYSRMRVPIMPIIMLYAAYGLYLFYNRYLSANKNEKSGVCCH